MAIVNITINDIKLQAKAGQTILEAAQEAGIHIPTLCHHEALLPEGACRLCLVEIEKQRALHPSCTYPVTEGMVVHTHSPKVQEARKFVLSMLFSERNHFCMYCQKTKGDCELQNAAYEQGMTHWDFQPNWSPFGVDASHPHYVVDNNRCILCRRCIRACGELVGNSTLGLEARGAKSLLVADYNVPFGESSCVRCGTCVQVCPTGALIDRRSAYLGKDVECQHVSSTCVGCSVGCGIDMWVRDNQLVHIDGDWQRPVNGGLLCELGRYDALYLDRARITTPLVRRDGALQPATWDEALDAVKAKLGQNAKSVAALASTRLPAEALYTFKALFADQLGGASTTSIEEGATTAALRGVKEAGVDLNGSLEALKAADCVVAVGADLVKSHQVAGFFVKRNLPKGTQLVVIDPFENTMAGLADHALQPKAGTDVDLLLGLMAGVVSLGLNKAEPAFDLTKYSPKAVAQTTGIPAETIVAAARMLAAVTNPVLVFGKGVTQSGDSKALQVLVALAQLVGATVIGTKGKANSLAAHRYELDKTFDPAGCQAAYVALGDDEPSARLIDVLAAAPFLAVQASYTSPLTDKADVVLPVEMWAEQAGHYVNLEGRLQETRRGLAAPQGVRSNLAVLQALADRLSVKLDANWRQALGA